MSGGFVVVSKDPVVRATIEQAVKIREASRPRSQANQDVAELQAQVLALQDQVGLLIEQMTAVVDQGGFDVPTS